LNRLASHGPAIHREEVGFAFVPLRSLGAVG
jgi:hypothetical protein